MLKILRDEKDVTTHAILLLMLNAGRHREASRGALIKARIARSRSGCDCTLVSVHVTIARQMNRAAVRAAREARQLRETWLA